jgi:hypothetical protein
MTFSTTRHRIAANEQRDESIRVIFVRITVG